MNSNNSALYWCNTEKLYCCNAVTFTKPICLPLVKWKILMRMCGSCSVLQSYGELMQYNTSLLAAVTVLQYWNTAVLQLQLKCHNVAMYYNYNIVLQCYTLTPYILPLRQGFIPPTRRELSCNSLANILMSCSPCNKFLNISILYSSLIHNCTKHSPYTAFHQEPAKNRPMWGSKI